VGAEGFGSIAFLQKKIKQWANGRKFIDFNN
jgi:hypothetical protein